MLHFPHLKDKPIIRLQLNIFSHSIFQVTIMLCKAFHARGTQSSKEILFSSYSNVKMVMVKSNNPKTLKRSSMDDGEW